MGRPLTEIDLGIPFFHQETDVWCWAAVAQMLVAHIKGKDATPPQCEIARMTLGQPAERWQHGVPDDALTGYDATFINLIVRVLSGRVSRWQPLGTAEELYAHLYFGHPVVLWVHVGQTMTHVAVVGGIRPTDVRGRFEIKMLDPSRYIPGPFWTPFEAVQPAVIKKLVVYPIL